MNRWDKVRLNGRKRPRRGDQGPTSNGASIPDRARRSTAEGQPATPTASGASSPTAAAPVALAIVTVCEWREMAELV
jgi:hypothetical protein